MSRKLSQDEVRSFWTEQSQKHGQSHAASWTDRMAIELEIGEILKHLNDGDRVLDVGCANGYSTVQFAQQRRIQIRGVDYIPEMIAQAKGRLVAGTTRGSVEFAVGDITSLNEPANHYDRVVAIRVLINLGSWDRQLLALRECARVAKPGGSVLLSEATLQGWRRLNAFRHEWGLPDIPMPPFNEYLDEEKVAEASIENLRLDAVVDFSSSYFVGTRVLKPLLIQALGAAMDVADPDMEWNRWFAQLPPLGDYGTQRLFVFRKT
jgi:ubiquinone/menaquinone biosynthesis C-methylase UbiE